MAEPVSVAIPVRNGGALLAETLEAVAAQQLDRPIELLVADSGSTDGSREVALRYGAHLINVPPGEFSHGGTRNLLAARASGQHVAFLSQDAVPADRHWLARLLGGFDVAGDVALIFGPYRARADASLMVRRELESWFDSLPGGVQRGATQDMRRAFFTDANGCLARAAWEQVPFREVAYAEDQLLARDMLRAGYAKVYRPEAAVIHSHDYSPFEQFRRSFDEWRGLREVAATDSPRALWPEALAVQRSVRDDVALARREGRAGSDVIALGAASLGHHLMRAVGASLGSRADRLPPALRRACSLERRGGFEPVRGNP